MKKRLNSDAIVNELKGNSGFFPENIKSQQSQTIYAKEKDDVEIPHQDELQLSSSETVIEMIRKKVREIGKENSTHRLTNHEKQKLIELVYQFRQQGIKTSENEIARIAINYLIDNFEMDSETSILRKVLYKLHS